MSVAGKRGANIENVASDLPYKRCQQMIGAKGQVILDPSYDIGKRADAYFTFEMHQINVFMAEDANTLFHSVDL